MDNYSKCLWIVEQLYRHGDMSFKTLAQRWLDSSLYDGRALANATFRRRLTEIAERMNIDIDYFPSRNAYGITNADDITRNPVYEYLLGAFHISSLSSLAQKHRNRVQLQAPPTGVELLHTILDAIDQQKSVVFKYRSYYAAPDTVYNYEVIPCFVRLFEGRWYVIAQYLDKSKVRVLALERMSELTIGETNCVGDPEINATEYYAHCYGIIRDDQTPQIIRLKFTSPQDAYINAKPLHESQTVVETESGYTVYDYFMRPSYDLTQEILKHGSTVEVVAPQHYRDHIKNVTTILNNIYL